MLEVVEVVEVLEVVEVQDRGCGRGGEWLDSGGGRAARSVSSHSSGLGSDPHRPLSYMWTCKKPIRAGTPLSWFRSWRTTPLRRSHDRRPPPAASGVQSRRGKPRGPSEKFWRVRPQGEPGRSRDRQNLLRAEPAT